MSEAVSAAIRTGVIPNSAAPARLCGRSSTNTVSSAGSPIFSSASMYMAPIGLEDTQKAAIGGRREIFEYAKRAKLRLYAWPRIRNNTEPVRFTQRFQYPGNVGIGHLIRHIKGAVVSGLSPLSFREPEVKKPGKLAVKTHELLIFFLDIHHEVVIS